MHPPILLASKMTNSVSPRQTTDHAVWFSFSGFGWSLVIKRKATTRNLGSPKASTTGEKIIYASVTENKIWKYLSISPTLIFFLQPASHFCASFILSLLLQDFP